MLLVWRSCTPKQKRLIALVLVGLTGLLMLCMFYFGGFEALAAGETGELFTEVGNKFKSIYTGLSVVITALAGIAIAICAVKWIVGGTSATREARQWLIYIVIGLALYWLAFLIISTIQKLTAGYSPDALGF